MRGVKRTLVALLVSVAAVLLPAAAAQAGPASTAPSGDPAPASVAAVSAPGAPARAAGVDDFTFDSFDADYTLTRESDGRSSLRTVEHLVARFPDVDQNRGIKRALVDTYDGHSTSIDIVSVTDENGTPRSYETEVDGEFLLVTIAVPVGQYVHGEQHYVIEYTQRDVTRSYGDTGRDEFYWDVNGVGWDQPFGRVAATVRAEGALAAGITAPACYYGPEGSSARCEVTPTDDGVSVSVPDIGPRENVTVALGFASGTFAGAPFTSTVSLPTLGGFGAAIVALVLALVMRIGFLRDAPGRGIVVAQYEPPAGVSAFLAANILGLSKRAMAASLVDLAVRGRLRIVEGERGFFGGRTFGLAFRDDSGLLADEKRLVDVIFGGTSTSLRRVLSGQTTVPQPGTAPGGIPVRWLEKNDTVLGRQVIAQTKATELQAIATGLRRKVSGWPTFVVGALVALSFVLFFVGSSDGVGAFGSALGIIGAVAVIWVGIGAISLVARRHPLTSEGARLKEHLEGLREYIRLAEADRLRMLQGVSGAERVTGIGGENVVKIYERLLPYAVLFGLEKEWAGELARFYSTDPDWYRGDGVSGFNAGVFASGIGSLSSTVAASYSGSSTSSSSGGSGGGGSSGGGGGGGGGGGV